MNIVLIVTMYKRHQLTDFVFQYYKNLKNLLSNEINLTLLACGSENTTSEYLAQKNEFEYIERPNLPLSKKHNSLLQESKKYNPDGVVLIGSDDIISEKTFLKYKELYNNGYDFIGFKDIYMYDGKLYYWGGYTDKRKDETVGAGRFFSKNLLDNCNWDLWGEKDINKGLDLLAFGKIKKFNPKTKILSSLNSEYKIVDIKTDENLTEIKNFKHLEEKPIKSVFDYFKINLNFLNKFILGIVDNITNNQKYELSVIISTYENVQYLKECFDSIENSIDGLNVEVLIGIDSCLKTREYVIKNNFPENFRFYFFEKNIGPYTVFNTLSNLSSSDNIMFFGSDDIMGNEMIKDIIDGLKFADCVRSSYINFRNPSEISKIKTKVLKVVFLELKKKYLII